MNKQKKGIEIAEEENPLKKDFFSMDKLSPYTSPDVMVYYYDCKMKILPVIAAIPVMHILWIRSLPL